MKRNVPKSDTSKLWVEQKKIKMKNVAVLDVARESMSYQYNPVN